MGFPIPEPFKWDDSFKVFYENLDKEHQGLFDGIFALCNDRDNAAVLGDLRSKVKAHFDTEEAMMTKANLPDLDEHKGKHAKFVSDLAAVTVVNDDTLKFAKEWLVNHIKETDFKYKGKL